MSEYTKEQMAEACERARHAYVPPHVADQLRAAAATLRSLRAKEQLSAATLAPERSTSGVHGAQATAGSAADPPPPEDALLAELTAEVNELSGEGPLSDDYRRILGMLQRARERIAADAEIFRHDQEEYDRDTTALEDKLAAAEARAQRAETALREFLAKYDLIEPTLNGMFATQWARTGRQYQGPNWAAELAAMRAALAPEPEGK